MTGRDRDMAGTRACEGRDPHALSALPSGMRRDHRCGSDEAADAGCVCESVSAWRVWHGVACVRAWHALAFLAMRIW
eukprot:CAMPEP_0119382940 /NCGR_PEP_ID=MMETSP1334-20130426/75901_1 /TAXON_ID=127549 /ORGANISM="Calcidiscus leptoporus, Strain RCC1130" /LENGTH=76 /DNA_ID=CAMNT_0007403585 /DNA_START=187 /DNA_END=414 /DNA_ORIENTATION=+